MQQDLNQSRKTLFLRLSAIVFFAELAHGMLLYGIIPELTADRFPRAISLFGFLPVNAVEIAGYCLAAYVLAELFFKLPAGHWVDHNGPDAPLRTGLVLSFITVPLILLWQDPHAMLLGAFLHGLGAAPIWPAVISAWTRGRSARERGEIMGQILTAWMAGLGLGVILGNVIMGLSGRRAIFAQFSPLLLWLIPLYAAVLWSGSRLGSPAVQADHEAEGKGLGLPRELWIMAIGLFVQNLAFGALILPFRQAVTEHLLLNPAQFGLLVLFGGAPSVVLLGPMGKLADRVGKRRAVIYSMIVVAPLIVVAPFLSYLPVDPWVRFGIMIPGLLVAAMAYAFLLPAWHALALGRIPEAQRGRSLALLMSIEMVALSGGHILGPSFYSKIHFTAPFVFAGVTFGALALIYLLGYILPPETPEEPHMVDLQRPVTPRKTDGASSPAPRSAE